MLPIGGPKGYGLSVAIGLLAGVLNGAAFGGSVVDFTADTVSETNTGQFILALDLRAFGAEDHFAEVAARAFAEMRASAPLPGHDAVRLPGDGRTALAEARRKEGLPLGAALIRDLAAIGAAEGIALPAPD
jgi:LDH2 family malate/lactate/ureidoglycolate dehydrogenase